MLQEVEKRLSHPIPSLAADLSLPPDLAAKVQPGAGQTQYGKSYGAELCAAAFTSMANGSACGAAGLVVQCASLPPQGSSGGAGGRNG